ncbi:MAG TPA: molybdopterin-dependent oxidoreductase [Thermoleophilaceae bacterium]|jgi:hypothetical protein
MNPKVLGAAIALMIACAIPLAAWQLSSRSNDPQKHGSPDSAARSAQTPVAKLPAPEGKTVLRISGVAGGNAGTTTEADFATLDRLASEQITIRDPFVKRDVTYNALRMSRLLPAAGVPASAASVFMHALDDYHVNLPIEALSADGYLATRMDGKPIPVAKGGPVRLVFTGKGDLAENTDNWIWSIDSMRVGG